MAQINLGNSEIPKIIDLGEQVFPGVSLDAAKKMLSGVKLLGTITLSKTLAPNETITVAVTITDN